MANKGFEGQEEVVFGKLPDFGLSGTDTDMYKSAASLSQVERAVNENTWADSANVNEVIELKHLMKELIDDKEDFVVIMDYFKNCGYDAVTIRKVFQELTDIDPISAYMDTDYYEIPPASVPRYNYGWGVSKKESYDYCYILPYATKYAIWGLSGFDSDVLESFFNLDDARKALKKHVKEIKDVTPESGINAFDITQKVASLSNPGVDLWNILKDSSFHELNKSAAKSALSEGAITEADYKTISQLIRDAEETVDPAKKEFEKEFMKYRDKTEGKSLDQVEEEMNIPSYKFDQLLEEDHQIDLLQFAQQAKEVLKNISDSLNNFVISEVSVSVDKKPFPESGGKNYGANSGSISFIIEISDSKNQHSEKAALVMFIRNGGIQYSGKFKGSNGTEYALSEEGINSYMVDQYGEDMLQHSPTPASDSGSSSLSNMNDMVGPNAR